ncbi:MAG: hypothetical protein ABIS01_05725 [Ferruginibacter sp.]
MPGNTTLDTIYIIDSTNNNVTLAVSIGDQAQTSDMTIRLDEEIIVKEHPGDFPEKILGTNQQLKGKKLSIVATIADTSQTSNLTSLTIRIKGGFFPGEFPLAKTVDTNGASADYLCLIEFFNP